MSRAKFIEYLNETDARTDSHFHIYRVQTHALRRLALPTDSAFLAIGLKGVGKTAAFVSLQDTSDVDFVQPISTETQEPHEIAASRPTLQYVSEIRSELILQTLMTFHAKAKQDSKLARKVNDGVRQEISVLVMDAWKKIKEVFGELGGITILGCGISRRSGAKKDSGFKLVGRDDYDKAFDLLQRLSKTVKFRMVVDDPEAIFSPDEHVNANLIAALVIAAHELTKKLSNFKCIILIKPNILQELRKVDEFVNLPLDSRVRLSWTDEELKDVIRSRATAAGVELKKVFRADPEPTLDAIVRDSRSGPRDALRRLLLQLNAYPDEPVTPASLEKTIGSYGEACFEQMLGPYERQYPGLARASIILFQGRDGLPKRELRTRLDQMLASKKEILAYKNEKWVRDHAYFADLLVQFGLVAFETPTAKVLPFHTNYLDEAVKSDAVLSPIPGLRDLIGNASVGSKVTGKKKAG